MLIYYHFATELSHFCDNMMMRPDSSRTFSILLFTTTYTIRLNATTSSMPDVTHHYQCKLYCMTTSCCLYLLIESMTILQNQLDNG
jgi:hypothetical protein